MSTPETPATYVSGRHAAEVTGIGRYRLQSLAVSGRIRVEVVPGSTARYALEDLLVIADSERSRPRVGRRPAAAL